MADFRFSVCSELFSMLQGMDFYDSVRAVKRLGADVELAPFTEGVPVTRISREEVERRRKYLEDQSVRVSGVHWILAGGDKIFRDDWEIPSGPSITGRKGQRRLKTADYAARVFEHVTYLRGVENISEDNPLVGVWGSPAQRNIYPAANFENAIEYAARTFARILNQGEHKVTVALERLVNMKLPNGQPNPRGETNFCYTMEQVDRVVEITRRKLARNIDQMKMRSMLDVKACVLSGDEPLEVLKDPYIIYHVHVQDPFSLGPPGWNANGEFRGDRHYDFRPLMQRLVQINKDGHYVCVSMEPFKPFFDNLPYGVKDKITPETAFRESLGYIKGIVRDYQGSD